MAITGSSHLDPARPRLADLGGEWVGRLRRAAATAVAAPAVHMDRDDVAAPVANWISFTAPEGKMRNLEKVLVVRPRRCGGLYGSAHARARGGLFEGVFESGIAGDRPAGGVRESPITEHLGLVAPSDPQMRP